MVLEDVASVILALERLLQPCFGPDGKYSKRCPPSEALAAQLHACSLASSPCNNCFFLFRAGSVVGQW